MLHTISLLLKMSAIVQASSRAHTAGCTGLCSMVPKISRMGVRETLPPNKNVTRDNHDLNHYLTMLGCSSILMFWVAQFFMTQIYSQIWKAFSAVLSPSHREIMSVCIRVAVLVDLVLPMDYSKFFLWQPPGTPCHEDRSFPYFLNMIPFIYS